MIALALFACTEPVPTDAPRVEPDWVTVLPEGGSYTVNGALLEVPAGAVQSAVDVSVFPSDRAAPDGFDALTGFWAMEPAGLVFDLPVRVGLPATPDLPRARFHVDDGASIARVDAEVDAARGIVLGTVNALQPAFIARSQQVSNAFVTAIPPLDLLVVMDNSCSMYEEQERLASAFVAGPDPLLAELFALDAHIGVTTTDMQYSDVGTQGKLARAGADRWVDGSTAEPEAVLTHLLARGIGGSAEEQGRAAAYTALDIRADDPSNVGFLRDGSLVDILFVTDEEDQTASAVLTRAEFVAWAEVFRAVPGDAVAHGIFQLPGDTCPSADTEGLSYAFYADETGGLATSVCDPDYRPFLEDLLARTDTRARITGPFGGLPVVVALDGVELPDDAYSRTGDTLVFDQGVLAPPGTIVDVTFLD